MIFQALLRRELERFGLGVDFVNFLEALQHETTFLGKGLHHIHIFSAAVGAAIGLARLDRFELIGGQTVTHLNGGRQALLPLLQNALQILPGVLASGEK